jgi:tetratricopeptide (TPR) repeat protein
MPRIFAVSFSTLAALSLLASGCGRAPQTKTSTSSAGASSPTVSGSTAPSEATAPSPTASAPVTYANAESSFTKRDYSKASELFSRYTDSNPENPWGFYMLGMSAWKNGEQEQAVAAFDRALQLDPDHQKSLFNSSRVLLEMGHPQEALERVEQALGREPMSNEGLRLLGRARYQVGELDAAIEAYQKALTVDERDVWSMNNLALIYLDQNRSEEAIPPLARAVELRGNAPVFQNNLGMALERSGYPTAAAKAYETAIALDSTYQKASVGLGRVTGGGQTPEETPVDLTSFSQRFQDEIVGWGAESSSDSVEIRAVIDSSKADSVTDSSATVGLSDSTHSEIEAVSDSVEDCQHEE